MVKFKIKQRIMHRTLSYRSDMSCTSTVIISDLISLDRFIADYTRSLIHNLSLFNFVLDLCFVLVDIVFLIATVTIMRFFLYCRLIHYLRMNVFYVDLSSMLLRCLASLTKEQLSVNKTLRKTENTSLYSLISRGPAVSFLSTDSNQRNPYLMGIQL